MKKIEDIAGSIISKTKGYKKQLNYIDAIIKKEHSVKIIKNLRNVLQIPPSGFSANKYNKDFIVNWVLGLDKDMEGEFFDILWEGADKITTHFDLSSEWVHVINSYIFFDKMIIDESIINAECSMACIADAAKEVNFLTYFNMKESPFPIIIGVSPYASKRELLNFIEKTYIKLIKPLQIKYQKKGIKIGKIRTRKNANRDDYIYNNRKKSLKIIRKMLAIKGIFLADGEIGKIISIEKSRRN